MWFALFGGYVACPTSETEVVEFTLSLKSGMVRTEIQERTGLERGDLAQR